MTSSDDPGRGSGLFYGRGRKTRSVVFVLGLVILLSMAFAAAKFVAGGPGSGQSSRLRAAASSVCATATTPATVVPAHTINDGTTPLGTIPAVTVPGASATNCAPVPTVTVTSTATTTPATTTTPVTTAPTTTANPPPSTALNGVYEGGLNQAGVTAFQSWLGRPVPVASEFMSAATWADVEGPAWLLDPWNGNHRLNLGVPMFPDTAVPNGSGDTATISAVLASCAAGSFNSHYTLLAQHLVAKGQANAYLRLAWEFNGSWERWRADPNVSAWKGCWQQIVTTMRAVSGAQFQFVWNPTRGAAALAGQSNGLEAAYPGDAYVDVIALDVYDSQYGQQLSNSARWLRILNDPYCVQWMLTFAQLHGKPMAFPEWGIVKATGSPRYGGGDNPDFINQMAAVIHGNNFAYQAYWDFNASDIQSKLSDGSAPAAAAAFKTQFGP